jgi:hypothetical protein
LMGLFTFLRLQNSDNIRTTMLNLLGNSTDPPQQKKWLYTKIFKVPPKY